jgi:uncharacterized protein YacL
MGRWFTRATMVLVAMLLGLALRPLAALGDVWSGPLRNLAAGLAFGLAALAAEQFLRTWNIWTATGGALGVLVGGLVGAVAVRVLPDVTAGFPAAALRPFVYLVALYAGGVGGARLAASLRSEDVVALFGKEASAGPDYKILDTSVIIDGRVADVCEVGFLEGTMVIPSFVLRELQYIADSSDPLRKARGRKGLEVLQKLKKTQSARVLFSPEDLPEIREVDLKLIELAKRMKAKLLTNDFNLNKVASLRGIEVLNLNDLANAVKPVVLPGESMTVSILKEGKEPGQGVAYLDDGTMVVVDNARSLIGRDTDIIVTSVIQTTAGKMFFGKLAGAEGMPSSPPSRQPGSPSAPAVPNAES